MLLSKHIIDYNDLPAFKFSSLISN